MNVGLADVDLFLKTLYGKSGVPPRGPYNPVSLTLSSSLHRIYVPLATKIELISVHPTYSLMLISINRMILFLCFFLSSSFCLRASLQP